MAAGARHRGRHAERRDRLGPDRRRATGHRAGVPVLRLRGLRRFLARARPTGLDAALPAGSRLLVVTKSATDESPAALAALCPPGVDLVMSSQAWSDYAVPGSPYIVVADGRTGRIKGEGSGTSFSQIGGLISQASADGGRFSKPAADRERESDVDRALLAAGIGPGDPSLYAVAEPAVQRPTTPTARAARPAGRLGLAGDWPVAVGDDRPSCRLAGYRLAVGCRTAGRAGSASVPVGAGGRRRCRRRVGRRRAVGRALAGRPPASGAAPGQLRAARLARRFRHRRGGADGPRARLHRRAAVRRRLPGHRAVRAGAASRGWRPGTSTRTACSDGWPARPASSTSAPSSGRPLCLYVVLGAHRQAAALCPEINDVIDRIEVS